MFTSDRSKIAVLVLGCIFILIWQLSFFSSSSPLDKTYRLEASGGMKHGAVDQFAYFLYYLNLFPITSTYKPLPMSEEGARDILKNQGNTLYMDTPGYWAIRFGDFGRGYLYLFDAFLKKEPRLLNVHPLHGSAFILSLLLLFCAFCYQDHPFLGMLIVILLGSNPFQLYEVYQHENVFGWVLTSAIFCLAINLPFVFSRKPLRVWHIYAPLLSGFFLGLIKQVRTEPTLIIVSVLLLYLTIPQAKWRLRVSMALLLVLVFGLTNRGLGQYFSYKITEAEAVVRDAGGYPLEHQHWTTHGFWHPFWCGLGDFDTKYGYQWDDRAAYRYGAKVLRTEYGIDLGDYDGSTHRVTGFYLDQAGKYPLKLENIPQYRELMGKKIRHDIFNDPAWYASIIVKRIKRVFTRTTPARLAWGGSFIDLPQLPALIIPTLFLLGYYRNWSYFKLLCFTLPLSLPAIVLYSGKGMTYYGCYHLFLLAFLIATIGQAVYSHFSTNGTNPDV